MRNEGFQIFGREFWEQFLFLSQKKSPVLKFTKSLEMYLLQEIIITELGFAKHELIQLQTCARRARVM